MLIRASMVSNYYSFGTKRNFTSVVANALLPFLSHQILTMQALASKSNAHFSTLSTAKKWNEPGLGLKGPGQILGST